MKILYFGTYERAAVRYRVIKKGLEKNGIDVVECHEPLWENCIDKTGGFYKNKSGLLLNILKSQAKLFFGALRKGGYDVIMVSYIGQFDMPMAKILSKISGKPIMFDPLVSLSETLEERGLAKSGSLISRLAHVLDKVSCKMADLIILDTNENIKYFSEKYGLERGKLCRVFVGADGDHFYPRPKKGGGFVVSFFGKFSPNHGIEYILEAAKKLENEGIEFRFIGIGQIFDKVKSMAEGLKNVKIVGWVDYSRLPKYYGDADVCLGMFKGTKKIKRVAATKVFEAMAMGKPLITGDCRAAREALTHGHNAILCRFSDSDDLANSILLLKRDKKMRERLSKNAYNIFKEKFSDEKVGKSVVQCLTEKGCL